MQLLSSSLGTSKQVERQLAKAQLAYTRSSEKIETGSRLNRAQNNPSGIAIQAKLAEQAKTVSASTRNANLAISSLQTAEDSLFRLSSATQRLKSLAVRASNGGLSSTQRQASIAEMQQIRQEMDRLALSTNFNTKRLLYADYPTSSGGRNVEPNLAFRGVGWVSVSGADTASGEGTLKAVLTSTSGPIRVTDQGQGVAAVTGYSRFESTLVAGTGQHEMAFSGTAAQLNATLRSLQLNSETGLGEITVDIVPSTISVFRNPATGTISYYEVDSQARNPLDARLNALGKNFNGLQGYLANITSQEEHDFVYAKLGTNASIGASDDYQLVNAATGSTYTSQAETEGKFFWIDGPEKGTQILNGNTSGANPNGVKISGVYSNFANGEPNNVAGGTEHYAHFYSSAGGQWNDYPATLPIQSVIEYGGSPSDSGSNISGKSIPIEVYQTARIVMTGTQTRDIVRLPTNIDIRFSDNQNQEFGRFFNETGELLDSLMSNLPVGDDMSSLLRLQYLSDKVSEAITTYQVDLGGLHKRLEYNLRNLDTLEVETARAMSNISDTDYAIEVGALTKAMLIQESATAMLSIAHALPNVIRELLK